MVFVGLFCDWGGNVFDFFLVFYDFCVDDVFDEDEVY